MTARQAREPRQISIAGLVLGLLLIIVGIANLLIGTPILTGAFPFTAAGIAIIIRSCQPQVTIIKVLLTFFGMFVACVAPLSILSSLPSEGRGLDAETLGGIVGSLIFAGFGPLMLWLGFRRPKTTSPAAQVGSEKTPLRDSQTASATNTYAEVEVTAEAIKAGAQTYCKGNDDAIHQTRMTSIWARIGCYCALCTLVLLVLIGGYLQSAEFPAGVLRKTRLLANVAFLVAVILTVIGIADVIIRRPNVKGCGHIICTLATVLTYVGFAILPLGLNAGGYLAIHAAIDNGHLEEVARLLEKEPATVNRRSAAGESPLDRALKKGNTELIELLIVKGADVDYREPYSGWTPLHRQVLAANCNYSTNGITTAFKKSKAIIECLIRNGADANAKTRDGDTTLFMAPDSKEVMAMLIANGGDVNSKNNKGETALVKAVTNGGRETVELLIANRADVNSRDNYGRLPVHHALWMASFRYEESKAIIECLLQNGADVNSRNDDGESALDMLGGIRGSSNRQEMLEVFRKHRGSE